MKVNSKYLLNSNFAEWLGVCIFGCSLDLSLDCWEGIEVVAYLRLRALMLVLVGFS